MEYANKKGVLLAFDSNDFDATDHTDGMLYPHAIPGNSVITGHVWNADNTAGPFVDLSKLVFIELKGVDITGAAVSIGGSLPRTW